MRRGREHSVAAAHCPQQPESRRGARHMTEPATRSGGGDDTWPGVDGLVVAAM
jgi:hypothetical protein